MHSFKSYLEEGRDAPLYHGPGSIATLLEIIKDNVLKGKTNNQERFDKWGDTSQHLVKADHFKKKNQKLIGISLSRDMKRSLNWHGGQCCFELNQRKLVQRHKVVPINIFMALGQNKHAKDEELAEEFVIGDIKNLKEYTNRIIFKKGSTITKFLNYSLIYLGPKDILGYTIYDLEKKKSYTINNKKDFIQLARDYNATDVLDIVDG